MTQIIRLISIDKKIKKYFKRFKVDSIEKLSLDQGNHFFIEIIKDFKNGKLTLDELSVFGFEIFHKIGKKNPGSDLFQASLSASELNFAIRSKAAFVNIPMYLKEIEEFLIKYQE